jgi:hypothetical protein
MTLDIAISTALGTSPEVLKTMLGPPSDGLIHQVLEPAWKKEAWSPRPSRDRQPVEELR